jgi:hypothetical protein
MAQAVGWGTWHSGYLCEETSGNLKAKFGGTTDLVPTGAVTYAVAGMIANDRAVTITAAGAGFQGSSGAEADAPLGADMCIAMVFKLNDVTTGRTLIIDKSVVKGYTLEHASGTTDSRMFVTDSGGTVTCGINQFTQGEWMVVIWWIDRGGDLIGSRCYGQTTGLIGTITQTRISTAFSGDKDFGNIGFFTVGDPGGTINTPKTIAAIYYGYGAGAASGLSANPDAAVTNLFNFLIGKGPVGPVGPAGQQGPAVFIVGDEGEQGDRGPPGDRGPSGAAGAAGAQGVSGSLGLQGDDGEQGDWGPPGPAGTQGPQGIQGSAGTQGPPGADGADGEDGAQGPIGPQGPQGTPGAGGSGATGTTIVDFGLPPNSDPFTVITGQAAILSGSIVEAWIYPLATADHTADEHMVEQLSAYARDIVAGAGFTVYLVANGPGGAYGKFTVAWRWS